MSREGYPNESLAAELVSLDGLPDQDSLELAAERLREDGKLREQIEKDIGNPDIALVTREYLVDLLHP